MTSKVASNRPSDHRRAALKQAEGDLGCEVSNFFPIERYYTAADKVLASFNKAFEEKRLDDSYVLGKRFARFSIESIPQHNYYHAARYAPLQQRNEHNVTTVISKLEQVTMWMDIEEAEKERQRQEYQRKVQAQRQKLQAAKIRKLEQQEEARYKELQERVEQQRKKSQRGTTQNVEQSALNKLQLLSSQNGSTSAKHLSSHVSDMDIGSGTDSRNCKSMSELNTPSLNDEPETAEQCSTSRLSRWQQQEEGGSSIDAPGPHLGGDSGEDLLPPPIPPPSFDSTPPPPSYNQVVAEHGKLVQPTNRRHSSSNSMSSIQRTVSAPAGGAVIRSDSSDLISFPEAPDEEILPPPPPYCKSVLLSCRTIVRSCTCVDSHYSNMFSIL